MSDFWNDMLIQAIQNMADELRLEVTVPTPADGVVPDWLANQLPCPQSDLANIPTDTIH